MGNFDRFLPPFPAIVDRKMTDQMTDFLMRKTLDKFEVFSKLPIPPKPLPDGILTLTKAHQGQKPRGNNKPVAIT